MEDIFNLLFVLLPFIICFIINLCMNQIYLASETLVSSSISRSVSWCDFQLTVSNAPNLTSELFFSKPKDIIYCKGFFLIENLTVSLSPDSLFNAPLFFFFYFYLHLFSAVFIPGP